MPEKKPVVLFLCSGNSCRSQMAEALLKHHAGDRFEVHSAGLHASEVHPLTRQVLAEKGLSMEGQYSKDVATYLGKLPVRHLMIVCAAAAKSCPSIWPGAATREAWPFDDPVAVEGSEKERLAVFRRVRDEIDAKIQEWLSREEG